MADNFHEVVTLLLARMESHPDEFRGDGNLPKDRADCWWQAIRLILECGTKEEKDAINQGIRKIKLRHAHEMVMDELCNGDERRKERENILNSAHNNMGASLRAAISPALQQIDIEQQKIDIEQRIEAAKNAYNKLKEKTL